MKDNRVISLKQNFGGAGSKHGTAGRNRTLGRWIQLGLFMFFSVVKVTCLLKKT